MTTKQYPECEKLASVSKESNKIGQFMDWLINEKGYELGRWEDIENVELDVTYEGLNPVNLNIESILAEYYNIDMNKVEKERQQILEDLRIRG